MKSPSPGLQRVAAALVVLALSLIAILVLWNRSDDSASLSPTLSVAVLFRSTGSVADKQSDIAGGLNLDLLDRLSLIEALQCIPEAEIFAPRIPDDDPRLLALRWGAESLVLGSVHENAGRLQVTIEVLDARTESLLEEIVLDDSGERILDLQGRVARRVVEVLPVVATTGELRRLDRPSTRSLKAWDAFAQGARYLGDLVNPRAAEFAVELLGRAVQLDPDFAQARARLSQAQWLEFTRHPEPSRLLEAERSARRALDQRPDMEASVVALLLALQADPGWGGSLSQLLAEYAQPHSPDRIARALAASWRRVGELEIAESSWLTAIDSAPGTWLNFYGYGQFLLRGGRQAEAEQAFLEAGRLAPPANTWSQENVLTLRLAAGDLAGAIDVFESLDRRPRQTELLRQMAIAYAILGRLDPAEILYRRILELEPLAAKPRQELGDLLTRSGRRQEAEEEFERALELWRAEVGNRPGDTDQQRYLALFAAKAGACSEAIPIASTLFRHQTDSAEVSHDLARAFAICGEANLALEALEVAVRQGLPPELVRSQPEFDPLASMQEFARILGEAEAPPPSP